MAGAVNIQVILRKKAGGTSVDAVSRRLEDLTAWIQQARTIARTAIQDEFLRGVWRRPAGGEEAWAPHVEHPEYFTHPQLIVTGGLLAGWMGTGSGAIEREDKASGFTIGVSGRRDAVVHRGGTTGRNAKAGVTVIFVTPKMRWFLGLVLGMWLKKTTHYIRIPSRPHATPDLATREAMRDALLGHLRGANEAFLARTAARAA